MENISTTEQPPSQGEAMNRVQGILHEVMAVGGNDVEFNIFADLIRDLGNGNITAKEAVERALAVQAGKIER